MDETKDDEDEDVSVVMQVTTKINKDGLARTYIEMSGKFMSYLKHYPAERDQYILDLFQSIKTAVGVEVQMGAQNDG